MVEVYEKFWDCKQCGHKHIRGGVINCPSCGKTRGSDTVFYKDENNTVYLNEKDSQKVINQGKDWQCSYCNSMNKGTIEYCINCGASKLENKGTYDYLEKENEPKIDNNEVSFNSYKENCKSVTKNNSIPSNILIREDQNSNNNCKYKFIDFISKFRYNLIICAIFLFFISSIIFLFTPKWNDFYVTNKNWEREVVIEHYVPVKEKGWTVPTGGRVYDKKWEYKTQNKIKVGTKAVEETYKSYEKVGSHTVYEDVDYGNGYGGRVSKQVDDYDYVTKTRTVYEDVYEYTDVYDWKYYYEIDKWVYARTEKASGIGDNRYWPEYILSENERVLHEKEKLSIVGSVNNKPKTYILNDELYNLLKDNKTYKVKVFMGKITEISTGNEKLVFEFK